VTDTDAGTASTPTGNVSWSSNGNGTFSGAPCTLTTVNGTTASCQVSYTPAVNGPHTLTATYAGNATTHAASTGSFNLAAVFGTTTTITCTPSPDPISAPTVCKATVTGDGVTIPSGTVTWSTNTGSASQFSATSCTLDSTGACSVIYT